MSRFLKLTWFYSLICSLSYSQNDSAHTYKDTSSVKTPIPKSIRKDLSDAFNDIASSFKVKETAIYFGGIAGRSVLSDGSYTVGENELKPGFLISLEKKFIDFPFNFCFDVYYQKKGEFGIVIFENVGVSPRIKADILEYFFIKGGYNIEYSINSVIYPSPFFQNPKINRLNRGLHLELGLQIPITARWGIYMSAYKDWGLSRVFLFDKTLPIRNRHFDLKDYFYGIQFGLRYSIPKKVMKPLQR